MLKKDIEKFCALLGLDTIGFIRCRRFEELRAFYQYRKENNLQNEFEEDDIEKRINPNVKPKQHTSFILSAVGRLSAKSLNTEMLLAIR